MPNKRSRKHHYLPRYYLKGFTNTNGGFFIYDKQVDKIYPSGPGATFFEKDLNTMVLPKSGPSDLLEKLYADTESTSWSALDRIRNSKPNMPIELLDKMHLSLFLLILHWRLPGNVEHIEKLSEEIIPDGEGIFDYMILKKRSGGRASEEITSKLRNNPEFKKITKLIAPFAPFYKDKDWAQKIIEDWRFLYTEDGQSWHIVGDRPIISDGKNDHDPLACLFEFVFPVSGKILLVNHGKIEKNNLPREFIIHYNIAVIERADRFVACQNEDFLRRLLKLYKVYVDFGKTDEIVKKMFKYLE
jgi:hypothetical protein